MKHLDVTVDWVPIVIANIAVYILGAIWYHALFGSQTKFANDMDKRDPAWSERNKASKGGPWGFFLVDFVLSALQGYVMSLFLAYFEASTVGDALFAGLLFTCASTPFTLNHANWEDRPMSLSVIHLGKILLSFVLTSIILTLWPSYHAVRVAPRVVR